MYAIIKSGGKQHRVQEGDIVDVELLGLAAGESVTFKEVLFVDDGEAKHVGAPYLEEFNVSGQVVETVKGPKVIAFKYKRRQDTQKKIGHRQSYSRVKITGIKKGNKQQEE
ncbi:MAG: 50S ribosomal protein L21 [Chlamydiota bacterium]